MECLNFSDVLVDKYIEWEYTILKDFNSIHNDNKKTNKNKCEAPQMRE